MPARKVMTDTSSDYSPPKVLPPTPAMMYTTESDSSPNLPRPQARMPISRKYTVLERMKRKLKASSNRNQAEGRSDSSSSVSLSDVSDHIRRPPRSCSLSDSESESDISVPEIQKNQSGSKLVVSRSFSQGRSKSSPKKPSVGRSPQKSSRSRSPQKASRSRTKSSRSPLKASRSAAIEAKEFKPTAVRNANAKPKNNMSVKTDSPKKFQKAQRQF